MNREHIITGGNDVKLWAGEWGNSNAPPIILIHGFMQSHMSWRAQLNSDLAKEFRLVAIDNRGHGRSENAHHGIADELVEHAAFVGYAVNHDGKILVQ